jgi:hypothetical protein
VNVPPVTCTARASGAAAAGADIETEVMATAKSVIAASEHGAAVRVPVKAMVSLRGGAKIRKGCRITAPW